MELFISAWNFQRDIQRKHLQFEDLPELATRNNFRGIEVMDRQLPLADDDYLRRLSKKFKRAKCGLILDVSSDLTYQEDIPWLEQIDYVRKALRAAKKLGVSKLRVLLGGQSWSFQKLFTIIRKKDEKNKTVAYKQVGPLKSLLNSRLLGRASHFIRQQTHPRIRQEAFKTQRAVLALQEIVHEAERLEIPLVIENHWGISSRPENIISIVEQVNSRYLGTCPDFDNFPKAVDPYFGLKTLAEKALHVHAKSMKFNKDGEEQSIDFGRCIRILKDAKYDGSITIEYEGSGDVLQGCLKTGKLIQKHWAHA